MSELHNLVCSVGIQGGVLLERDFTVATFRLPPFAAEDAASFGRSIVEAAAPVAQRAEPDLYVFPALMAMTLCPAFDPEQPDPSAIDAGIKEAYLAAGSYAARTLGATVVPGSVYVRSGDDRLQEYAAVFDRQGNLVGEQRQTHVMAPALAVSDELTSIAVEEGVKIGLLLGRDAWHPEVSRILALSGADILVAPLAPQAPYRAEEALWGLWQEVQQNQTFGIEAGLQGSLGTRTYGGRAAIFGPCEITPQESGFLPQPGYFVGTGSLVATLKAEELQRIRREYPIFRQLNPGLYRKHLPMLYRRPR
ncbi:MAG: hypothetical protein M0Z66_03575 [Thermaerobacter sp.]|nr:hypothetical protein [Thermaerobacter sp.]